MHGFSCQHTPHRRGRPARQAYALIEVLQIEVFLTVREMIRRFGIAHAGKLVIRKQLEKAVTGYVRGPLVVRHGD